MSTARVVLCAASPKNRTFSFQSGADAFLVRPFHLDELTDADRRRARPRPRGPRPPPPRRARPPRRLSRWAGSRSSTRGTAALYDRAVEVLERRPAGDGRCEVGGSIGPGTADAWSDLDLEVVTDAEHHDAFLADRDTWLAAITPTVFARTPIAPFVINTITDEGLTFDIAVWAGEVPGVADAAGALRRRPAVGLASSTTSARRSSTRWPSSSAAWPGRSSRLLAARGAPPPPHRRPAPPRPAHHRVPRRDRRGPARQALERHLHRGAARRGRRAPAGERHPRGPDRLRPRPRRAPRHPSPPAVPPLRPRVARRPRAGRRHPRPGAARHRHQRLAATEPRRRSSPSSGSASGPRWPWYFDFSDSAP